ncbi:MAG: hypothetical protein KF799_15170 [Bdellovibrionales bacterium]|nr:hypothetical protein [Bdellovibrionales bacterium]
MRRLFGGAFMVLLLSACGANDYGPPREQEGSPPVVTDNRSPENRQRPVLRAEASTGHLWSGLSWVRVSDETIRGWRCSLKDTDDVSDFQGFGASVLGGAVIGVVIRASGSNFLGQPIEPGPGHWFWNRLDQSIKTAGRGIVRGALLAGVCETALAGGNLTPFSGILGQDFVALSTGLTLGGLSMLAASPLIDKRLREKEPVEEVVTDGAPPQVLATLRTWAHTSDAGRGLRYKLLPKITVVGAGSGIGYLVYHWIQGEDENGAAKDGECLDFGMDPSS